MKILSTLSVISLAATMATAQQINPQTFSAQDARIAYMGRTSTATPGRVQFTYPGVTLIANFSGTSIAMKAKPGSGYFMATIDDHEALKVFVGPNDSIVTLAEALPQGSHHLQLMYAQEGYEQRPYIESLMLDNGSTLLDRPSLPDRRIEFIGNSITCGYGVEAHSASEHFTYDTENHYYTYAAITARALHAQHHATARSGIGIYKNYGGPVDGSKGTSMPDKYSLTLFTDSPDIEGLETWNAAHYVPDVICVNLGTNDTSLDTYDTKLMKKAYVDFMRRLRNLYPDAKIVMLCGSMMTGKALDDCRATLDEAVAQMNDNNIYRFNFTPHNGSLGYGADWHPSLRQQQKMADELIPFLRKITGWQ